MKYFVFYLMIVAGAPAFAQTVSGKNLIIGTVDSLHSNILNEERALWVSVPDSTNYKQFPVLYLLDGDWFFTSSVGMIRQLRDLLPDFIIIGVLSPNRNRDLTPTKVPGFDTTSGGAERFTAFIEKELIPHVDSAYPTAPYRVISGHSLGGLMVVNTFIHHNALFNDYIAIEPSLWWDHQLILKQAEQFLSQNHFARKSLYLAVTNSVQTKPLDTAWAKKDTGEQTAQIRSILEFRDALQKNSTNGLIWSWKYYPHELHGTIELIAQYDALNYLYGYYLFRDYDLIDKPGADVAGLLSAHYKEVSSRLGYLFLPPESMVNSDAYNYLAKKEYKKALGLFELNVVNFPDDWNSYDSLGDYYSAVKDKSKAITYYKKALTIKEDSGTRKKLNELTGNK